MGANFEYMGGHGWICRPLRRPRRPRGLGLGLGIASSSTRFLRKDFTVLGRSKCESFGLDIELWSLCRSERARVIELIPWSSCSWLCNRNSFLWIHHDLCGIEYMINYHFVPCGAVPPTLGLCLIAGPHPKPQQLQSQKTTTLRILRKYMVGILVGNT